MVATPPTAATPQLDVAPEHLRYSVDAHSSKPARQLMALVAAAHQQPASLEASHRPPAQMVVIAQEQSTHLAVPNTQPARPCRKLHPQGSEGGQLGACSLPLERERCIAACKWER